MRIKLFQQPVSNAINVIFAFIEKRMSNSAPQFGIIAAFANGNYFECAVVAFFMLIASLIEHRTAAGALKTIESLIRITPTKAVLLTDQGEQEVQAKDLKPGDVVLVLPGDNIPGDGTVRAGNSTVDQANITGESVPVEKAPGDEAFAGTINETGRLEIEITRAGEDSTLGKVQSLILQAAASKPAVVRELSKYASYYTPVVIILAFIIFQMVKMVSRFKKEEEAAPSAPPEDTVLLRDIRDLLKKS